MGYEFFPGGLISISIAIAMPAKKQRKNTCIAKIKALMFRVYVFSQGLSPCIENIGPMCLPS